MSWHTWISIFQIAVTIALIVVTEIRVRNWKRAYKNLQDHYREHGGRIH